MESIKLMKTKIKIFNNKKKLFELIKKNLNNKEFLSNHRPIKEIDLRPREVFGLLILSIFASDITKERWYPASDPENGRDGLIYCDTGTDKEKGVPVEQVFIPPKTKSLQRAIKEIIQTKNERFGKQYCSKHTLIIFNDSNGMIHLEPLIKFCNSIDFENCYLISKTNNTTFEYSVFTLKSKTHGIINKKYTFN